MGQVLPLRREFADPWVPKKVIAAHFSVCTSTVDNWTRDGMPYRQVGGRRKYRIGECEAWEAARRGVKVRPRLEKLRRVWAAAVEEWRR